MASKFDNVPTGAIADEFGEVKQKIEALEEREKELREELITRMGDTPVIGQKWMVKMSIGKGRETLDAKALRTVLGEDALKPYTKIGEPVVSLRVKPSPSYGQAAE